MTSQLHDQLIYVWQKSHWGRGWVSCWAVLDVVEGRKKHFYLLFRSHNSKFVT